MPRLRDRVQPSKLGRDRLAEEEMEDGRLCYHVDRMDLSSSPDGTVLLLVETADGEAHLSLALSSEAATSLALQIAAWSRSRPNRVVPE